MQLKYLLQIFLLLLSLFVLWLDGSTPLGLAVWLLYYLLLMVISYVVVPKLLLLYAAFCTLFIIIGGFISIPHELPVLYAIENRAAAVIVLWILTYVLYRNRIFSENLQKQTRMLSSANRELESFNYTISHDLKNPLIVIKGFCQLLISSTTDKLDNEERDSLSRIVDETQHMNNIITDLLRLSSITKQEIAIETIDLSRIAQDSFESLSQSAAEQKRYEFYCQPDMKTRADPGLMRILFNNLIGNAIKFSFKNDAPRIEFGRTRGSNEWVYFIKDNGAGFDMSKSSRIFEPFTRMHSASDFPGTGIGLSIVRRIIERHNGRIWVESEIEKGTTFYFVLGTEI